MFSTLRTMMNAISTPSLAEVEGRLLLARLDREACAMRDAIRRADGGVDTALLSVAYARLSVLKEAAIAARALRPEHIRFSGALACLQCGSGMDPMIGVTGAQILPQVA